MTKFMTFKEAQDLISKVGYQARSHESYKGSGARALSLHISYEITRTTKNTVTGEFKTHFIGRINKTTWNKLYTICNMKRNNINNASGTSDGMIIWVSKK